MAIMPVIKLYEIHIFYVKIAWNGSMDAVLPCVGFERWVWPA
jgi:hypothetical protein